MADPIAIIFIIAFAVFFWVLELAILMRMPDADFPGRFDKPLWVAILVFTFVLGAMAFGVWKLSVAASRANEAAARRHALLRKVRKPDCTDET